MKLTDEEIKEFYNSNLDLYKWCCAVPNCRHYTKVWRIHGKLYGDGIYAWLRTKAMKWLRTTNQYFICGKHYIAWKKRKIVIEKLKDVVLLKQNVRKRHYTLITKINK